MVSEDGEHAPLLSPAGARHEPTMFDGRVRVRIYHVVWVSLCFFILFTSYNTVQNYVTTLLSTIGNDSLAILYGINAVSNIFAPFFVNRLGEKWTMFIGAMCYCVYIVSLIKVIDGVVFAMSGVIGFGAALLWIALGSYLVVNSSVDDRGRNSGIFWGIFQMCNIFGNLIAFFAFTQLSTAMFFVLFTCIAVAGTLMMIFLKNPPVQNAEVTAVDTVLEARKRMTIPETLKIMLAFLLKVDLLLLWPLFFLTGFEAAFWTGEFPQLLPQNIIGLVLMGTGIGDAVGGFLVGTLSDFVGRPIALTFSTAIYGFGLYCAVLLKQNPLATPNICMNDVCAPWSAWVAGVCFGIGDGGFNTQVYAFLGEAHPTGMDSVAAMTIFSFIQNLGSLVGYFYATLVPMHGDNGTLIQVWIQVGVLIASLTGFLVAFVRRKRRRQQAVAEVIVVESSVNY